MAKDQTVIFCKGSYVSLLWIATYCTEVECMLQGIEQLGLDGKYFLIPALERIINNNILLQDTYS